MMSPTRQAETVITDALPGERRAFTIQATGKAFRTLIDGLYENKIGALVRELMSNGYDSHAKAQIADQPITVVAPTALDPVFRVRDYGVSMDHATIMDMYSTMFASSKEDSNDEVGMFGLGSKSPFAYVDTFSVTAYLDGEKRVYVAHVANDGTPQITHVATQPQGDDPQGIEVSVPAKPTDVQRFSAEIQRNIIASETTPEVDGLTGETPAPLAKGDGWKIYDDNYGMGRVAIRQGCVIYPVHANQIERLAANVQYGYTLVVDVPIGSVDVTASRESLALTPVTEQFVTDAVSSANQSIRDWTDSMKFDNRLHAFRSRMRYEFLTYDIGQAHVKLTPDLPVSQDKLPAQTMQYLKSQRKYGTLVTTDNPDNLIVLVERTGEFVLRKALRIGQYYANHSNRRIVVAPDRDLPRLVRLLGLKASQVISVSSLPDVPVAPRAASGQSGSSGFAAPKTLAPGKFWVLKTGQKRIDLRIGDYYVEFADRMVYNNFNELGFTPDLREVEYLTQAQADKLGATQDQMFVTEIVRRAKAHADKTGLQAKLDIEQTAHSTDRIQGYYGGQAIRKHVGLGDYNNHVLLAPLMEMVRPEVLSAFKVPQTPHFTTKDLVAKNVLGLRGKSSLTDSQIDDKVKEVAEPFKPLFKSGQKGLTELLKLYLETQ